MKKLNYTVLTIVALLGATMAAFAQSSDGAQGQAGSGQTVLTLEECKEMALQNNVQVRNSRLDVLAAKAQRGEAKAEYFPTVSLSGYGIYAFNPLLEIGINDLVSDSAVAAQLAAMASSYGIGTSYEFLDEAYGASLMATAPLYAGGRIVNGNRLAALGVESSQLQNSLQERKSGEEVENDYWQVISLNEKMRTVETLQELLDTLEKDINSAVAAGLATDSDRRELRLKQNDLKATKTKLRGSIRLAKMNLCNGIGLEYNPYSTMGPDTLPRIDDIVLADELELEAPEAYWRDENEILALREETQLLGLSVEAKELEKKMTRGEVLPQLAAGVSYGYGKLLYDGSFNGAVFATLKVPITDWGKYSRKIKRYDYQVQKAQNEQEYMEDQLLLQIRQYWLDVTVAWEQTQVAEESVEVSQKDLDETRAHYAAGLKTLSDVLEDETALRQSYDDLSDARIAYREALTRYINLTE